MPSFRFIVSFTSLTFLLSIAVHAQAPPGKSEGLVLDTTQGVWKYPSGRIVSPGDRISVPLTLIGSQGGRLDVLLDSGAKSLPCAESRCEVRIEGGAVDQKSKRLKERIIPYVSYHREFVTAASRGLEGELRA